MTEYTDVPRANALHAESQQVAQALANLQAGGTISNVTVSPPIPEPPTPGDPAPPPPPVMMMAVYVTIPPPVDPTLLTDLTTWLEQRLTAISDELTTLGVTVPPPGDAQWSIPPSPLMPR